MTDVNLLKLFKPLADIILKNESTSTAEEDIQRDDSKAKLIVKEHKDIFCKMNPISWTRFQQIISHNSHRFDDSVHDKCNAYHRDIEKIINALCHPKTIRSACDLYLQQIRECNDK